MPTVVNNIAVYVERAICMRKLLVASQLPPLFSEDGKNETKHGKD